MFDVQTQKDIKRLLKVMKGTTYNFAKVNMVIPSSGYGFSQCSFDVQRW